MSKEFDRFFRLATHGAWPGASSGAFAAAELADCVLRYGNRLDGQAHAGLLEFLALCVDHSQTVEVMLEKARCAEVAGE